MFCAGFFLLKPLEQIFDYFNALLDIPNSFDSKYMEQNLLNYAHRRDGTMPYKKIPTTWNIRAVNDNDFEKGVASMHEK
jgi:alpha-N-acetylglucosamine transferase